MTMLSATLTESSVKAEANFLRLGRLAGSKWYCFKSIDAIVRPGDSLVCALLGVLEGTLGRPVASVAKV